MADGPLRRLFWRVVDELDYLLTLARLRNLDALAGPEPRTPADQQRARDWERIEKAFPRLGGEQPGAVFTRSADRLRERDYTARPSRQPSKWLDGQAPPKEGDSQTAAQRSERRRREISDRRMPTRREVLEVFQDGGVHPKAANDLHAASARAATCHSDRSRPGVGDEMLKSAGESGSHHLLRRQQRQESEENDAAPGEDAK
jgi:hypothetical protein